MKSEYNFNPDLDWGPGTESVHQLLAEWASIDWFEPPFSSEADAVALFREHHALVLARRPDLVSATTQIRTVSGGWRALCELTRGVRYVPPSRPNSFFLRLKNRLSARPAPPPVASSWNWKYGVLKKMSRDHWRACDWSPDDHARCLSKEQPTADGELFFRVPGRDTVFWNAPTPKLVLSSRLREEERGVAQWYLTYATGDLMDGAAWQLAQGNERRESNPFTSLIQCYAAGYLPVALSAEDWVLFSFREGNNSKGPVITPRGF